jgi:hypothetical protein
MYPLHLIAWFFLASGVSVKALQLPHYYIDIIAGHLFVYLEPRHIIGGREEAERLAASSTECSTTGHLADLSNDYIQTQVTEALAKSLRAPLPANTWIGLSDQMTEGDYRWTTNQQLNYTRWAVGQPSGSTLHDCVALRGNDSSWVDYPCLTEGFGALIEYNCPPDPYMEFYFKDHIYEFYPPNVVQGNRSRAAQFVATKSVCEVRGHLADLSCKAEADAISAFVIDYLPFRGVLWIGLNDEAAENNFTWSDGTPAKYFLWGKTNGTGELEPNGRGSENCVYIDPANGKWHDYGTQLLQKHRECLLTPLMWHFRSLFDQNAHEKTLVY